MKLKIVFFAGKTLIFLLLSALLNSCFIPVEEPVPEPTSVKDIDGNTYSIVKIGNQTWMAENLRVTRFRNGDAIPTTTPANADLTNNANPIYQWAYNGENLNAPTYGRLYSWKTVTDARKLAPQGWHIPTEAEWNELISHLGGADVAGGKMKSTGIAYWVSPNEGATNQSGFNALPAGNRNLNGTFYDLGYHAGWWSSTVASNGYGTYKVIHKNEAKIFSTFYNDQKIGFSVRCIKD